VVEQPMSGGGKYAPLRRYLSRVDEESVTLSFARVEEILGARLPASATTHSAWWGNETKRTHVQARAWMNAGWRVTRVNLERASVTFGKAK
jgi:hypothetical protein